MDFTIKTRLQRVKELTLKIESYDRIHILFDGQKVSAGCYGLAIMDAFARPTSWEDALLLLKSQIKHPRDWVEINSTIRRLIDKGILMPEAHSIPSFRSKSRGFDAAAIHVKMLNDRLRTTGFLKAINSVVRAGDVVVDIGTGSGVLAVAAARAGARHVYAIESTGIAKIAKEVFAANGLAEKITLVEGRSTGVNLPEKADVMISETVGNHPFAEGLLETVADATKRLLKPGARMIPAEVEFFGIPVHIPDAVMDVQCITDNTLHNWREWYGVDFVPLKNAARKVPTQSSFRSDVAALWQPLATPARLVSVNLSDNCNNSFHNTTKVAIETEGRLNGILSYFELALGAGVQLSTHPQIAGKDNNWKNMVWLLPCPINLLKGEHLSVTFTYRTVDAADGITVEKIS
ncbi:MAG TPA: 50S ribosomal protein L11 methyltransferase [Candidatus Brocadiaceae bacterium]|nr:50S ribosomal protein L11 methyltransferase [Candidatus Brocadiaceae bacterium]